MSSPKLRGIFQELLKVTRRPQALSSQSLRSYDKWKPASSLLRPSTDHQHGNKSYPTATHAFYDSTQKSLPPSRRFDSRLFVATGGVTVAILLCVSLHVVPSDQYALAATPSQLRHSDHTNPIDGLTLFRLSEIKEHGSGASRPWVIHDDKVYDITDWIPAHPGGQVILRAAGGSIEPYWDIFTIHKTLYAREILDQYLIGRVHPDDLKGNRQGTIEDPFISDPVRDERLRVLTQKPCNAESPGDMLADSFLTPNELFYKRNHMWVPVVDDHANHDIDIELPNGDVKTYSVHELQTRFKQHAVTAVLQCSGNRRKHMTDHAKKTNGLQWTVGAISCAKWEGVRLRDVLAEAGLPVDTPPKDALHVQFTGLEGYGASIPIESALDPRGDVLLAFRMNDEPLPRDHGFPVRVIVPGHVAARSVKWVNRIIVSDDESNTSWQRKDYKCFGPNETKQEWDKYKAIQQMPVTSAITRTRIKPFRDSTSDLKTPREQPRAVEVEGYAYSGGGHEIQRVDISLDGGMTWDQAKLIQDDAKLESGSRSWCWKRWKYEAMLPDDGVKGKEQKTTIVVKATDDVYNTQPETYTSIYNLRGNLATAWHRVDLDRSPT